MSFIFCILIHTWDPNYPREGAVRSLRHQTIYLEGISRYKPINPEPSYQSSLPSGSCTLVHYPPALITPGPGNREPGTVPLTHCSEIIQICHHQICLSYLPVSSCRSHNTGSTHSSPCLFHKMIDSGTSLFDSQRPGSESSSWEE